MEDLLCPSTESPNPPLDSLPPVGVMVVGTESLNFAHHTMKIFSQIEKDRKTERQREGMNEGRGGGSNGWEE